MPSTSPRFEQRRVPPEAARALTTGSFQITTCYWCGVPGPGGGCGVACEGPCGDTTIGRTTCGARLIRSEHTRYPATLRLLFDTSNIFSGTLDKLNSEGWSPLMYACSSHHVRVIGLLLRSGAGANFPGTKGLTPLMIASRLGAIDVAKHLLQHMTCIEFGINVADAEGWTALFHAVYMGQEETVRFLLSNGAKVNVM
ncbi:Ankyrin repeat and KH domain-containing protein mask [Gryllus bimaculatus]|nr:Ankyrin repeat and KH domain-containing protein mask [Gryllus bimaculatus]